MQPHDVTILMFYVSFNFVSYFCYDVMITIALQPGVSIYIFERQKKNGLCSTQ